MQIFMLVADLVIEILLFNRKHKRKQKMARKNISTCKFSCLLLIDLVIEILLFNRKHKRKQKMKNMVNLCI